MSAYIRAHRVEAGLGEQRFELLVGGVSPTGAAARDILRPLRDAGAAWWDERGPIGQLDRLDPLRRRIEQGPPAWTDARYPASTIAGK
jgi:hypothetical protein